MLPGMVSRVGSNSGGLIRVTQFVKGLSVDSFSTSSVIVPQGFTKARFTCFAAGGGSYSEYYSYDYDYDGNPDRQGYFYRTGNGGMMVQSTVRVFPGETLTFVVAGPKSHNNVSSSETTVKRSATVLLLASTSAGNAGASTYYQGDLFYKGGEGVGSFNAGGGGAAGTGGPGGAGDYSVVLNRGSGISFKQTSNGEIATNESGGYQMDGKAYGGGAGYGYNGGPGIVIIEWGFGQDGTQSAS